MPELLSRTRNRVSRRRRDSGTPLVNSNSKCCMKTVLVGNDQLLVARKVIFPERLLIANHRLAVALSLNDGTFTSYAITPGFGVSVAKFVNAPVPEIVVGSGDPVRGP